MVDEKPKKGKFWDEIGEIAQRFAREGRLVPKKPEVEVKAEEEGPKVHGPQSGHGSPAQIINVDHLAALRSDYLSPNCPRCGLPLRFNQKSGWACPGGHG